MLKPKIVGKTTKGDLVFAGADIFEMHDTHGFPLAVVLHSGYHVDWVGYFRHALTVRNLNVATIYDKVIEALKDGGVYSHDYHQRINLAILPYLDAPRP